MKKIIVILLVFTLVLGTATGCQLNENNTDNSVEDKEVARDIDYTPELGGQIILPLTTFNTLNPLMTENTSYYFFSKLIFEALFQFDKDLNIENQLAESYKIGEDGQTIDIKLRDNILWHDGERLKAQDVLFTINTIKYANTDTIYNEMLESSLGSYRPSDIRRIMDVSLVDEQNLSIRFDRAFSNNLEVLTFPIIPSHIFGSGGNASYTKALAIEDYNPIGTGPFKFDNYEKMKQISLRANEEYRTSRAYLDKVIGKVFDSEEDILQAFETREVNLATTIGVDWEKYKQEDAIRSIEFISSNYEFLGFNFDNEIFAGEMGKKIRKAISYAIDRQAIIEKVYLGHGTQIDLPIHPDSWLLSEEANVYGYNIDIAKQELGLLNLEDSNEDGILELDGQELTFRLLTNSLNPLRMKTAKIIKADLEKIGIKIEIYPQLEEEKEKARKEEIQAQWIQVNEEIKNGNFDIALIGWQLSVIPDLSFAFHSSQIEDGANFINYSSLAMDDLLDKVFSSKSRQAKQNDYKELQAFIVEELPYSSLLFKNKSLLLDSKIMGELEPTFFNPYKGMENIFIPKDLQ